MIKPQLFTARFEDKTILNDKFMQLSFELEQPHRMEFVAGQYISLQVNSEGLRRSYSVCSSPSIDHGFELLIDVEPDGVGTHYLQQLQFGQKVTFMSPLGIFTIQTEPVEPELVFVATGSGIAPFRSMIFDLLQSKNETRQITLHWGLRHVHQLFWQNEFSQLSEDFPNFHFHPVISQPATDWLLCQGRVTDCLSVHDISLTAGYYICGSNMMVSDVRDLLLQHTITENQIHHEKFN